MKVPEEAAVGQSQTTDLGNTAADGWWAHRPDLDISGAVWQSWNDVSSSCYFLVLMTVFTVSVGER